MTGLPDGIRWQLWTVAFGFFMQSLDTITANIALSSMAQSLKESPLHMHMVTVSHMLTVAVILSASDWLADKVGTRNTFFTVIVLSTLGSLLCALSGTLNELLLARVLRDVGDAVMVSVGGLAVMKIVPREQCMAAMISITLPGQVGPLFGLALGDLLVEYASWYWIFLINILVGIIGAIVTLMLMPNYIMQARRPDPSGFLLLAVSMAVLTLALDGSKGTGLSSLTIGDLVVVGVVALILCLLHTRNNNRTLFSLKLFRTRTFSLGPTGSSARRVGSNMLLFTTPIFLQISLGFSPFHARLMMAPVILGSMGVKRIIVQVVSYFGYRRVLAVTTLGLPLVTLLFMTTVLLGWYYVLSLVLSLQGIVNSTRFSSINTLALRDLPDNLTSSRNGLLSMVTQLSMNIGVTTAGLLLGLFGSQHASVDSDTTRAIFMYTWLSTVFIIALPVLIFARVPNDTHQDVAISRRKGSAQRSSGNLVLPANCFWRFLPPALSC